MTSLLFPDCSCPFHPLFCGRGFTCSLAPVNLALVCPGDVSMAFESRCAGVTPCHCWGIHGPVVLKSLIRFFKWTYLFCALNALLHHCLYVLQYLLIFPSISSFHHHMTWTDHLTTHVTLGQVILTMTHRLLGLYYRFQTLSHDDSF
jgi:hypothetical protein